ncbi:hypothetical protein KSU1_A0044 [Candidatus Jettenia caeni]|uniref:Uncharacterized protein n=1 Tax=Candidatus Jettenia caeni TaxID=247490 RepID=I3IGG6_9BACT|nr:hypothetical protein KSU1_A0044 [Candidatus Jettenia caeni]
MGLDEAKVRKYIQDQEESESIEDKYDSDLSNPLRDTGNNALIGLIKPPAMRVVLTLHSFISNIYDVFCQGI